MPIWRASSGHFLIKPEVNGIKGNYYWLLDTGASGFVISPKAALTLGLEAFGELFAASIAGKVRAWQAPEAVPRQHENQRAVGLISQVAFHQRQSH